jgi:hypothetical protein
MHFADFQKMTFTLQIPKQRIRTKVRKMTATETHILKRLHSQQLELEKLKQDVSIYKDLVQAYKDGENDRTQLIHQRNTLIAQKLDLVCQLINKPPLQEPEI